MQIMGHCYLLLAACSVLELYQGILQSLLGLILMDCASYFKFLTHGGEFKGGFFLFGCSSPTFSFFGLFFIFVLGLKILKFTWCGKGGLVQFLYDFREKSYNDRNRVCSKNCSDENCGLKFEFCKYNSVKFLRNNSKPRYKDSSVVGKQDVNPDVDDYDDDDNSEMGCYVEDEEFDVLELKRLVKIERMRGDMVYAELEKERMAAASAAGETMAMILRLQNEKSSMEIEANRYRRLAEQKEEFHQEVIQSLQWNIMQLESEISALEEKLEQKGTEELDG